MEVRKRILLEFSGGLEVIFDGKKECKIDLPGTKLTLKDLLEWMQSNMLKDNERREMLIQRDTVRPGVLVLVNQTDWEIIGGLDADLSDGDTVTFISTLHGG
ncbi:Ubiquitin-related modifier 1-like protein [Meloidogyne graminicola]|uniref:Ubiquitin-related modifier 1 homolog n=1 Tax=Meloidogyne graminicola TaxID=189291 RepID=A0A8S9ZJF8_9BILA|nr:Ubiquitin-related modifier 1-like protein [Meloidogyne graminicola]